MSVENKDLIQSLAEMIEEEVESIARAEVASDTLIYLYIEGTVNVLGYGTYKFLGTVGFDGETIKFDDMGNMSGSLNGPESHRIHMDCQVDDPGSFESVFKIIRESASKIKSKNDLWREISI